MNAGTKATVMDVAIEDIAEEVSGTREDAGSRRVCALKKKKLPLALIFFYLLAHRSLELDPNSALLHFDFGVLNCKLGQVTINIFVRGEATGSCSASDSMRARSRIGEDATRAVEVKAGSVTGLPWTRSGGSART